MASPVSAKGPTGRGPSLPLGGSRRAALGGPRAQERLPPVRLLRRSGRCAVAGVRGDAGLHAGRSRGTWSATALVHEAGVFLLHRLARGRLLALRVCLVAGGCLRLRLLLLIALRTLGECGGCKQHRARDDKRLKGHAFLL